MHADITQPFTPPLRRWSLHGALVSAAFAALVAASAGGSAHAAWEENGRPILTVREFLPYLSVGLTASVRDDAAANAAVLCDAWALEGDPKAMLAALLQSDLRFDATNASVRALDSVAEPDRAARRRGTVAPITVSASDPAAIGSGAVALYGHLIPPPYRLDRMGDEIRLNGVTIVPAPGEDAPAAPVTPLIAEAHERMSAALTRFRAQRGTALEAAGRLELLGALRSIPGISEAEWLESGDVRMVRGGHEEYVTFESGRAASPDEEAARNEALDGQLAAFRSVLENDGTLLCGATYAVPVWEPAAPAFRSRIEAIVRSSEPDPLRVARLQAYTNDRAAAADLVFSR